jgi:Asp-tRNA(Asn)/Glu-tRNA(Gln) amidotransferase C subunit
MKAREIRERLKGRIEPEVVICMTAIAELQSAQQQELKMMAEQLDATINILSQLTQVAENMKSVVDQANSIRGDNIDDSDLPPN